GGQRHHHGVLPAHAVPADDRHQVGLPRVCPAGASLWSRCGNPPPALTPATCLAALVGGRALPQALLRAFDCESVDDVELKGRNAAALGDLLVHQQSQGPWSHYRLNDVDPNPLDRKRRRVAADAGAAPGLKLTAASGTLVEEDHERRRALDRT